jgi:hypothetical protein
MNMVSFVEMYEGREPPASKSKQVGGPFSMVLATPALSKSNAISRAG